MIFHLSLSLLFFFFFFFFFLDAARIIKIFSIIAFERTNKTRGRGGGGRGGGGGLSSQSIHQVLMTKIKIFTRNFF